jgi:hypothetical protein
MKKLLLSLTAGVLSVATMYGQGRVNFNNQSTFNTADAITIGAQNMGAVGGLAGQGIGGDKYSVQLRWAAGTITTQAAFDAAVTAGTTSAIFTGPTVFLANTGPLANFSGFFDAGTVANVGAPGTFTMQTWAWYSVGNPNWQTATGNKGASQLFTVNVTAAPTPVNATVFPGFTVVSIPEPSTFALAGLGAAALLLFRRRK